MKRLGKRSKAGTARRYVDNARRAVDKTDPDDADLLTYLSVVRDLGYDPRRPR